MVEEWVNVGRIKGDKGAKGDKGDTGGQGKRGESGKNGTDGSRGPKGNDGDTGKQGKSGTNGKDGSRGEKGDKGDKGDKGSSGSNGSSGSDGKDAIVDSGSRYLKFENGIKMAWGKANLTYNDGDLMFVSKAFAIEFDHAPYVALTLITANDVTDIEPKEAEILTPSAKKVKSDKVVIHLKRIKGMTNFKDGDKITVHVLAIGK